MKYEFDVFADYFQFYVEDEAKPPIDDPGNIWNEQAIADLLATGPGYISVGTVRNMTVPVTIEIHPALSEDDHMRLLESADHVVECSLEITSQRIVVMGCTDYYPDAPRIPITSGIYQVRIYYSGLNTLRENGLEGDDEYRVVLFPGIFVEPKVLKRGHY